MFKVYFVYWNNGAKSMLHETLDVPVGEDPIVFWQDKHKHEPTVLVNYLIVRE